MKGFSTQDEMKHPQKPQESFGTKEKEQLREIKVYGHQEWYLVQQDIEVHLDGKFLAKIPYKGVITVNLDYDNHCFEFQWKKGFGIVRKCQCFINKTFVGGVQIVTHRWADKISCQYTL